MSFRAETQKLLGQGVVDPLAVTAGNFVRAVPLGLFATAPFVSFFQWDALGCLYAVLSGAVASGAGYALWYGVVKQLSVVKASSIQLCVPILTVLIGAVFLGETLSLRLVGACIAVLGGIALVLSGRRSM